MTHMDPEARWQLLDTHTGGRRELTADECEALHLDPGGRFDGGTATWQPEIDALKAAVRAMDAGAATWQPEIDALKAAGYRAEFTQTGGMCAAIFVPLADGEFPHLLITDQQDSLAWKREDHAGWCVGYYASDDGTEARNYAEALQGDIPHLLECVAAAVAGFDGRMG